MNMETNSDTESLKEDNTFFKNLLKKHLNLAVVLTLAIAIFFALGIFIAVWWVENSHYGGFGLWTLNDWSLVNLLLFTVYLVGLEVVVFAILGTILLIVLYFGVYVKLPEEERILFKRKKTEEEKKRWKQRTARWSRKKESGGFGFFIFISFLIFILIDGNLETNIGALSYSYWFFAWLKGFAVMSIVGFFIYIGYGLWILQQPE
jgi:hypothetical protein